MIRRYLEWDYVANTVTEWEREGECKQCGACCRCRVTFKVEKPYGRDNDKRKAGGHRTSHEGIWQEVNTGRWRHFFQLLGIDLTESGCGHEEDGVCDCHDDPDRPWICAEWPFSPRSIIAFPDCGYSFKEISYSWIEENPNAPPVKQDTTQMPKS